MSQLRLISPHLEMLSEQAPQGEKIYLVGGAVRDALMQRPNHDLDLVVEGDARPLARRMANRLKGDFYMLDAVRQTARVLLREADGNQVCFDFATLRYTDIEGDLRARDFSINAIAIDLLEPGKLIDPTGGAADLHARRLKACSDSAMDDDPIRILRGVRLSLELGLRIEPHTAGLMRRAVPGLQKISPERIRDEIFRLLNGEKSSSGLRLLDQMGALAPILPELTALKDVKQSLPHHQDAWEHTLATITQLSRLFSLLCTPYLGEESKNLLDGLTVMRLGHFRERFIQHFIQQINPNRSRRSLLTFAALYHDSAKPQSQQTGADGKIHFFTHETLGAEWVEQRAAALALSQAEVEYMALLVRHHLRIHLLTEEEKGPSSRAIYRFLRSVGSAGVDLVLLALADRLAIEGIYLTTEKWIKTLDVCRLLLETWWEKREQALQPVRLVNGEDLMIELNLQPGKRIGELLEAIAEAQALGEITDRAGALGFARDWLSQYANP